MLGKHTPRSLMAQLWWVRQSSRGGGGGVLLPVLQSSTCVVSNLQPVSLIPFAPQIPPFSPLSLSPTKLNMFPLPRCYALHIYTLQSLHQVSAQVSSTHRYRPHTTQTDTHEVQQSTLQPSTQQSKAGLPATQQDNPQTKLPSSHPFWYMSMTASG